MTNENRVNTAAEQHRAPPGVATLEAEMSELTKQVRPRAAPVVPPDPQRDDIMFCESTGRFVLVRYFEDGWIMGAPCNPRGELDPHERPQLLDEHRLSPYSHLGGSR